MQLSSLSLARAIDGFLIARRANGLSESTARIYRWVLGWLLEWHGGEQSLASLTPDVLRRFFIYLETERKRPDGAPLAAASRQNAWVALRALAAWARDEGGVELVIPARPRGQSPEILPFTDADLKALLKAAERLEAKGEQRAFQYRRPTAARDTALILTLIDTGLRIGEACRLTLADVDLSTGQVVVHPYGTGRKTKRRVVHLGRAAIRALWRHITARQTDGAIPGDLVFTTATGRELNCVSVGHLLRNLGRAANVPDTHPHRFRHTFAIQYLRNGGDVFTLQRLLGHSSLEMVRRYLALADADAATAHQRASPADRWRL